MAAKGDKGFARWMKWGAGALLLAVCALLAIDCHVRSRAEEYILDMEQAEGMEADCVMVLGAGVWGERPSHMLQDRLDTGIAAYFGGAAPKLLMSGDHGRAEYDEVNVMKDYALEKGVSSWDVFMDHAGFSTYESMYRARDVFDAERVLIVTQRYHLYRAVYTARQLGLEAYGLPADLREYRGQTYYDLREIAARNKDFFMCLFEPEPTYLGEVIPVSGNGDATNDRKD